MPFKTKHGSHYHERRSCPAIAGHDVMSVGDVTGLAPCSICCGGGKGNAGNGIIAGVPSLTESGGRLDYLEPVEVGSLTGCRHHWAVA